MSRLRYAALKSLPGTAVPGAASYLAFVAIGRYDSVEVLGYVSLGWVLTNVCSAAIGLGPAHTALREISGGSDEADIRARFRTLVLTRALVVGAGVLLIGLMVHVGSSSPIGQLMMLASPWLVGQSLVLFESETLRAAGRYSAASAILSARAVIGWGTSVIGAVTVGGLVATVLPTALVGLVVAFVASKGRFANVTDDDRVASRAIGRPVSQMSLASYALGYGDFAVVQVLLGPSAVAVYTLGYQLGIGAVELLTTPITAAAMPRIVASYQSGEEGKAEAVSTALRLGALILGITALASVAALALGMTPAFDWISEDPIVSTITAIVALAVGLQSLTRLAYSFLLARGRTDWALRSYLVAGAFNLLVSIGLTHALGLTGAALATLLGYGSLALITIWAARTP